MSDSGSTKTGISYAEVAKALLLEMAEADLDRKVVQLQGGSQISLLQYVGDLEAEVKRLRKQPSEPVEIEQLRTHLAAVVRDCYPTADTASYDAARRYLDALPPMKPVPAADHIGPAMLAHIALIGADWRDADSHHKADACDYLIAALKAHFRITPAQPETKEGNV